MRENAEHDISKNEDLTRKVTKIDGSLEETHRKLDLVCFFFFFLELILMFISGQWYYRGLGTKISKAYSLPTFVKELTCLHVNGSFCVSSNYNFN